MRAVQRNNKVDAIAVLDHSEIEGALRLAEVAPFPVIVGEEVLTKEGEIGGLFLKERIPPGLPLKETADRIKEQGGLVYAPHPLARDVPRNIGKEALLSIIERVDIIEGFNARIRYQSDNEEAKEIARRYGIAVAAGSDAHFPLGGRASRYRDSLFLYPSGVLGKPLPGPNIWPANSLYLRRPHMPHLVCP